MTTPVYQALYRQHENLRWDENLVILTGMISQRPRFTTFDLDPFCVCNFPLANIRRQRERFVTAEDRDPTFQHVFDIVAWGDLARDIHEYYKKGSHVYIRGQLSGSKPTEMANGKFRRQCEVVVDEIKILSMLLEDDDA